MSSSSSSSKHSRLKQVIEKLHQQSVIKIQRTKPNGKTEYKVISPLEITEFNDFLMQYLLNLVVQLCLY